MDEIRRLIRVAADYYVEIDGAIARAAVVLGRDGVRITCGKGCAWCCCLPVRATLPEGLLVSDFVRENLAREEVLGLTVRVKAWLSWNEARGNMRMSATAAGRFDGPGCPFLSEGVCVIYPVRPMGCRVHSSTADPAFCGPEGGSLPLFIEPGTVGAVLDAVKPICLNYRRRLEGMGIYFEGIVKLLPELVLEGLKSIDSQP